MKILLSLKLLNELGACNQGLIDFVAHFGSQPIELDWTRETQIELIKTPLCRWFGWVISDKQILPAWSMRNADLRNANLQYANLQDVDLRNANLQYANLQDANLQDADLQYANLQDANLQDANLQDADLHNCIRD